ncbi:fimbrial assembly protein [Burkholderia sp. ABCPW 14]|nr:fimbrial assembly protein [Burkholderia sp. ABCPW 14]
MLMGFALSGMTCEAGATETSRVTAESIEVHDSNGAVAQDPIEFDSTFMVGKTVDASRFSHGNPVLPGIYAVDLFLNDTQMARERVRFIALNPDANAAPCLTLALLNSIGVETSLWSTSHGGHADEVDSNQCINLTKTVPAATVTYNSAEQRLDLNVPQASLRRKARGEVDPSYWQRGETAGIVRYDLNAYHSSYGGDSSNSAYLGLGAGLNVGDWRLRYRGSMNYGERTGSHWQSLETYAQRDLTRWKAQLTLGDSTTRGDVFDSFGVRGVQLTSDDRMLPDSMRGFAPVVRGVAQSNAKVEVKQNGQLIYQTTVAPGPFEIKDLNPTGYGGDLQVIVMEADGQRHSFSVPYATVPQLLRPGVSRFSVALGRYRNIGGYGNYQPYVAQTIYQRGFTNLLTGYGGLMGSQGYGAALLGVSFNTPAGALAVDVTAARTQLDNHTYQGQSWRLSYAKYLPQTATSFTMAAYRYSTSGYFSLADAVHARGTHAGRGYSSWSLYRKRNRVQLNVSQKIADSGSLYAMGIAQDYWNRSGRDLQFQIGYSGAARWGSYSVSVQRNLNAYGTVNNQVYASVSIPLGGNGFDKKALFSNLNMAVTTDGSRRMSVQASTSGSAGSRNQWSYGVNAGYMGGSSHATSLGGHGMYNGGKGAVSVSASMGRNTNQASLGLSGSIVAHKGGITLGQPVGQDSPIGLVEAKGAEGAAIINSPGVLVNSAGYAVVPYLSAYRVNTLALDPQGISEDVELGSSSRDIIPRAGAVVRATFDTKVGKPMLMRVKLSDGEPVPMGADVMDTSSNNVGVVGQGGTVFVRGVPDKGKLSVRWAEGPQGVCGFSYQADAEGTGVAQPCTTVTVDPSSRATQAASSASNAVKSSRPTLPMRQP